ncbi:MAG: hypothetical protein KC933_36580, partial [Myxococcales bacterium]|nr:hypothetical protein [Myxococcales bacterium]
MSWLNRLSQTRVQAQQPQGAEAPKGAKAKAAQPLLQDTLASEKVLKRLGASVANSGDDMQAIAAAVTALKTHRAAQFGRAVDAFYNALGRSTQHLPDAEKRQVVSGSIRAMRGLVEAVGPHDNLIPAMTALSSLLEPRGNTRDVPAGKHAEAAKTMILGLLDELEGRAGVSSLMFGFRNVVEAVESRRPELKSSQRPAIWQQAAEYLGRAVPVTGCDQGELGRIVGTFQRALRETPDDSNAAFTAALRDVQAELTAPREALSRQLGELVVGLREGTPARAAADAMMGALAKVVEANPSGPATLLGLVEALANRALPSVQRVGDEGTAAGYGSLARVIELAARAPGVEGILQYLVDHHAMLAESPEARAALARVDRLKLPNNLAGALLKAHVIAVGMDPAQADLAPALAKLERLPPGPGLQAAAVLLERLDHDPVDLMEALHVESRRIQDPAELRAFADRFQ